ncbi:aldehyde dehydrogenase family protein [Asaia krungthepensis]|uniref:Aldehyde dehydrogenase n=1 Tax=Asaia krungthepensis NRIC 0535 TaxID=1307925 RepID=A0ABQ0Q4Z0_9PROT|nr:aldehyde dehydrogenase family protein [Asaia krungthepensis]GBQ91660.1 aldehyde dehydrogenase [Asaia krungthepensis NRIC 0535]
MSDGQNANFCIEGDLPAADAEGKDYFRINGTITALRTTQGAWRLVPLSRRLAILRRFRRRLWKAVPELLGLIPDHAALDVLTAEVLPLIAASRFLTREAREILSTRSLSLLQRPLWLFGVSSKVKRVPLGVVLILAPGNYPLMLAGVQALQAIIAGNVVALKPAPGRTALLARFVSLLEEAGLPRGVIRLIDEEAGPAASAAAVDLIVLTGSARTGRAVAQAAAQRMTPTIMELSGSDPVFVLPTASLAIVARALHFGLTLKSGHTCIAPRRVFVPRTLIPALRAEMDTVFGGPLTPLRSSQIDAVEELAQRVRDAGGSTTRYMAATIFFLEPAQAKLADLDLFAPWLAIIGVDSVAQAIALERDSVHALGASIFGDEREALTVARSIAAGTICINDVIVPSADPRLPFGGARSSGWGVTRGREGLLSMTRPVSVSVRRRAALHLLPWVRARHRK